MLVVFKYYFGLTSYFQNHIYLYTQLTILFQTLKAMLFYNTLVNSKQHQLYTSQTKLGLLSSQKLACFLNIQDVLVYFSRFVYYYPSKISQIDLNAFKKFSFRAMLFYITIDKSFSNKLWPTSSSIQPIFIFYRLLTPIKRNFRPIKHQIANFIKILRKIRYLIEFFLVYMIIQADYLAILDIFW